MHRFPFLHVPRLSVKHSTCKTHEIEVKINPSSQFGRPVQHVNSLELISHHEPTPPTHAPPVAPPADRIWPAAPVSAVVPQAGVSGVFPT